MHTHRRAFAQPRVDLAPDRRRRAGERPGSVDVADGLARDVGELVHVASSKVRELLSECPPHHPMFERLDSARETMQRAVLLARRLNARAERSAGTPQAINLNSLAGEMCPLLQRLTGPFITLDVAFEPRGAWVAAEPGEVEQVILNLVMNARDALPLGGTIRVATRRQSLEAPRAHGYGTLPAGNWVVIEVRDSGAGIDELALSHLLEPGPDSRGEELGAGSGLAMVHDVIQRAGGWILVDTAAGAGTTIAICLPSVEAPRERRALRGTPQAVLVVDADEWARASAAHVLRRAGYAVLEADHAATAIELLQDVAGRCIRLILVDAAMPGADGRPFVEAIRRDRPTMQVMVMLGRSASPPTHGRLEAGSRMLVKPFAPADLLQAIRERFANEA